MCRSAIFPSWTGGVAAPSRKCSIPYWRRRGGRLSIEINKERYAALTCLPPRRSRSKTIARFFPSCPGGEICSPIHFPGGYSDLFSQIAERRADLYGMPAETGPGTLVRRPG
jgi:hypothetical protein